MKNIINCIFSYQCVKNTYVSRSFYHLILKKEIMTIHSLLLVHYVKNKPSVLVVFLQSCFKMEN